MTWNYRIIKHDTNTHPHFAVHEVFYDEVGNITSWTADPIDVTGESKREVLSMLKQMLTDSDKTDILLESHLNEITHVIL